MANCKHMCMLEPTDNCEECMYVWQMSYLLVSMRLGLPEGVDYYKVAKYSPTGATGTEERHSLWLSIVAAMFECGGLGRHRKRVPRPTFRVEVDAITKTGQERSAEDARMGNVGRR